MDANPWLQDTKLVAKPDQLIKRRGKGGLLLLDATWDEVVAWVGERMGREVTVDGVTGTLSTFFVEPFHPHPQSDEVYLCIQSNRDGEEILFHHEGGVEVGDVDAKALRLSVPTLEDVSPDRVRDTLTLHVPNARRGVVTDFITALVRMYRALHFTYLEINPLVARDDGVLMLDMAAKLDETAEFVCGPQWGDVEFPAPFGREPAPEEAFIRDLDSKTGASLKLTILNAKGRIWTMVAGGGASVVYADTITDLGECGAQRVSRWKLEGPFPPRTRRAAPDCSPRPLPPQATATSWPTTASTAGRRRRVRRTSTRALSWT